MSSKTVKEDPTVYFENVYKEEKKKKGTYNPILLGKKLLKSSRKKIAELSNVSLTKKDDDKKDKKKDETTTPLDRKITGLSNFAENNSGDDAVDAEFAEMFGKDERLKSIEELNTNVEKIKLFTISVKEINEDVEILRDIINELYILSKKTGKDNEEKIKQLTRVAKTMITKITKVVGNINTETETDLKDLGTAIDKTKEATNIKGEVADLAKYKDDNKREELYFDRGIRADTEPTNITQPSNDEQKEKRKKRPVNNTESTTRIEGESTTRESAPNLRTTAEKVNTETRSSQGGNPYKTAKKQLSNIMSYIPGMSRKTQKKHRKHRKTNPLKINK
jgi:hypothetical protein